MSRSIFHGKGAQFNPKNPFDQTHVVWSEQEDHERVKPKTKVYQESSFNILSRNQSADLHFDYSVNPYQGCEHGCSYCYARTTHEYWGMSAGLDFETRIMVKENAPELLSKRLRSKSWKGELLMFSGNTDCYQPLEKRYQLTRRLLEICLSHRQAVNIITKNHLVTRDIDLLQKMADFNLVQICLSITTLDDSLRLIMEPRTSTIQKRFEAVKSLSSVGIPVSVNIAPVIPGLNDVDMPQLIRLSKDYGAYDVNYATVRLNGTVAEVFRDWLKTYFPDRLEKVWNGIKGLHDGAVSEKRERRRMKGKGPKAEAISQLFHQVKQKYFGDVSKPLIDTGLFRRNTHPTLF